MMNFFERLPLDAPKEFEILSFAHGVALFAMLVLIVISYIYLPKLKNKSYEPWVRYGIIAYLILSSVYKQWFLFASDVPWYVHLPEATCGLAILSGTLSLLTKNRILFLLTFFWGWGAFTALFAPNILEGPDRYYFYQYYIRHALIVIAALYMIRVYDCKVHKKDFWIYFGITLPLALLGMGFSYLIDDPENLNMFYMLQPAVNNPFLDGIHQASHLLYVIFWLSIASLFGYLYGLPFYTPKEKKE